jgi:hypothetical protein
VSIRESDSLQYVVMPFCCCSYCCWDGWMGALPPPTPIWVFFSFLLSIIFFYYFFLIYRRAESFFFSSLFFCLTYVYTMYSGILIIMCGWPRPYTLDWLWCRAACWCCGSFFLDLFFVSPPFGWMEMVYTLVKETVPCVQNEPSIKFYLPLSSLASHAIVNIFCWM